PKIRAALNQATQAIASGKLRLPITTTYKPSQITEAIEHYQRGGKVLLDFCLSSIILSPSNSNVKMSPHETGDIHVESEGATKSERDQRLHQGRHGVCQRRRTPVSERAPH